MTVNRRIFLDTSVIFSAVLSKTGDARKLFQLGEADVIQLVVGENVLRECEDVIRRKAPVSLPKLALLLELARIEIAPPPSVDFVKQARTIVSYRPDAYVLAEAIGAKVDWFITHDKKHFLKADPGSNLNFRIGTPGDLIQALDDEYSQF